jgi:hypothetical protein
MFNRRARSEPVNCWSCLHFVDDPRQLERALPGLTILSSAWGSTRGNAGLCARYGTWQDPVTGCEQFAARPARVPDGCCPCYPAVTSGRRHS